jgi:hypothetical protein
VAVEAWRRQAWRRASGVDELGVSVPLSFGRLEERGVGRSVELRARMSGTLGAASSFGRG